MDRVGHRVKGEVRWFIIHDKFNGGWIDPWVNQSHIFHELHLTYSVLGNLREACGIIRGRQINGNTISKCDHVNVAVAILGFVITVSVTAVVSVTIPAVVIFSVRSIAVAVTTAAVAIMTAPAASVRNSQ